MTYHLCYNFLLYYFANTLFFHNFYHKFIYKAIENCLWYLLCLLGSHSKVRYPEYGVIIFIIQLKTISMPFSLEFGDMFLEAYVSISVST